MIEIKVNCKGSHDFPLSELFILQDTKDFQLKELNKNNFEKLKNGIIKKGFWFPFFVWHCEEEGKWYYTDGTQRHKVLNKMAESGQYKMPDKFPCSEIFAKDKKEAAEAILTQSSSYGKFTEEGLYGFIHEYDLVADFAEIKGGLELPDFDLDGFESGWMDDNPGGDGSEDEVPEVPEVAKSKLGDLFQLGEHRLLCGDATSREDVARLINKNIPTLMVTDPPYGVNYEPEWRNGLDKSKKRKTGKVNNDDRIDWSDAYKLYPGDIIYVWHAGKYAKAVAESIENCGFEIIYQIIWNKQHFVMGRGDYHWKHEPCWYAVRKGKNHNWQGARDQSTVWDIRTEMGFVKEGCEEKTNHSTQKPVECMLRPILNNSNNNDKIYDPFSGSGSTLIACEKTNRSCYALELNPLYIDVIIKRWEDFTGKKAVKL